MGTDEIEEEEDWEEVDELEEAPGAWSESDPPQPLRVSAAATAQLASSLIRMSPFISILLAIVFSDSADASPQERINLSSGIPKVNQK